MPYRPISKELQAVAIEELHEDPKRIEDDLKHIREWAEKQPHLKIRTDDQWLLSFLRGCKYSLETVKKKLDAFYTMRTALPDIFSNRDPFAPELQRLLKSGGYLPLPKPISPGGPIVIVSRLANTDITTTQPIDVLKLVAMIIDILIIESDNAVIAGIHIFGDNTGITLQHFFVVSLEFVKKLYALGFNSYPLRPKGMHVINMPFAELAMSIMKTIGTRKHLERAHFYGNDPKEIYKTIPMSVLPKEYGGDAGSLEELKEMWTKKVESYRDWFLEDEQYGVDESKRPEKLDQPSEDLFGTAGTFKKLNID